MKFYLMRHCAVDIPTGQPKPEDIPLDPVGELQAHVMRKFLKRVDVWPDVIISSDLPRAEDTAKIMQRGDTPLKTTPWLRPDGDPVNAWNSITALAGNAKVVLCVTHGPLIERLLASVAFCFLDEGWYYEHGGIAYINTHEARFRWFMTPKLAAHIVGEDPKEVENVIEGIASGALAFAESLMANTRAATITPLRNQMRQAVNDRWKRQLKRVKRSLRKSKGLTATSAQAMLSTVIPGRDSRFAKKHRAIKGAAYSAGVDHTAGQLGLDVDTGGAVQGIEAVRKPVIPKPNGDSLDDQGYNLEDELDKTTVDRAHTALASIADNFTVAAAVAAMAKLYDGFQDPESGKLSRADTVALQTVSDGYHAGGKDTAAEVADTGSTVQKRWETGGEACPECIENEADGWIDADDTHSSGDDAPPAHPNCDCSETYRVQGEEE